MDLSLLTVPLSFFAPVWWLLTGIPCSAPFLDPLQFPHVEVRCLDHHPYAAETHDTALTLLLHFGTLLTEFPQDLQTETYTEHPPNLSPQQVLSRCFWNGTPICPPPLTFPLIHSIYTGQIPTFHDSQLNSDPSKDTSI